MANNEITIRARKNTRPKLQFNGLISASFGKSPKPSDDTENATWLVFNDEAMEYVDTGIRTAGENGKSAYALAVEQGFEGTLEEWLESLIGADGFSPTAEMAETEDGVELTITDKDGAKTALIPRGPEGPAGSDANVTSQNIRAALGYTPGNEADVEALQALIPEQASQENLLADKEFVNSSIGTNTANYISHNGQPFESLAQLQAYTGTLTNNDYAFVVGTDDAGNVVYTRYKWNADTESWAEEYKLNNSSFTAAQWAAIQSGITGELVETIGENKTAIEQLETAVAGKAEDTDVYHEYRLTFDGETIKKDGEVQTFAQVYAAVNDKSKFVYIVYLNRLYIPQYHDSGLVSFSCSYLDGTTPTIRRIRIAASGTITTATETMYNKVQVDTSLTEIKKNLTRLDETKVGYSEVVGGQLLMYSDSTKAHLLATLDLPTPDLTDYVKNTDYAAASVAGVVKAGNGFALSGSGITVCPQKTAEQYKNVSTSYFIGKGTLDNVLAAPSIQPALTPEEQLAGRQRLGITDTPAADCKYFAITEDIVTVTTDDTKGVSPYSTTYGYTNIEIAKDAGIRWVEGGLYAFVVDTKLVVASSYRNVRVRIGGEDDGDVWHPLFGGSSIASGSSFLIKNVHTIWQYKTVYRPEGALHVQADNNTTYTYLVNTITGDTTDSPILIDANGYGAKYSLAFPTTPLSDGNGIVTEEKWSSLVLSASTGTTKKAATPASGKFYINRHPVYIQSANIAKGDKAVNPVYQDYTGYDCRYTANTSATYVTKNRKAFLWLKNFNPEDMSFESDATVGNIMTLNKISTRFPSTVAGEIYLYFLGWSGSTYYTITPAFTQAMKIFKYTPSTGKLEACQLVAG